MPPENYASGSYSHAEGAQSFAVGHWNRNKEQELSYHTQQMSDALSHMAKVASMCGLSLTEAMSALQRLYSVGGKASAMAEYAQEIEKTSAPAQKIETPRAPVQEKKNPYLQDFEIPHYDFEDIDLNNFIDF